MKTNETLAQKLCLLDLVSLLSYTAALLAALCFLVLLPGCSLGEKVDREPVQTLECTRPASLSGLYPAGGMSLLQRRYVLVRRCFAVSGRGRCAVRRRRCGGADRCGNGPHDAV